MCAPRYVSGTPNSMGGSPLTYRRVDKQITASNSTGSNGTPQEHDGRSSPLRGAPHSRAESPTDPNPTPESQQSIFTQGWSPESLHHQTETVSLTPEASPYGSLSEQVGAGDPVGAGLLPGFPTRGDEGLFMALEDVSPPRSPSETTGSFMLTGDMFPSWSPSGHLETRDLVAAGLLPESPTGGGGLVMGLEGLPPSLPFEGTASFMTTGGGMPSESFSGRLGTGNRMAHGLSPRSPTGADGGHYIPLEEVSSGPPSDGTGLVMNTEEESPRSTSEQVETDASIAGGLSQGSPTGGGGGLVMVVEEVSSGPASDGTGLVMNTEEESPRSTSEQVETDASIAGGLSQGSPTGGGGGLVMVVEEVSSGPASDGTGLVMNTEEESPRSTSEQVETDASIAGGLSQGSPTGGGGGLVMVVEEVSSGPASDGTGLVMNTEEESPRSTSEQVETDASIAGGQSPVIPSSVEGDLYRAREAVWRGPSPQGTGSVMMRGEGLPSGSLSEQTGTGTSSTEGLLPGARTRGGEGHFMALERASPELPSGLRVSDTTGTGVAPAGCFGEREITLIGPVARSGVLTSPDEVQIAIEDLVRRSDWARARLIAARNRVLADHALHGTHVDTDTLHREHEQERTAQKEVPGTVDLSTKRSQPEGSPARAPMASLRTSAEELQDAPSRMDLVTAQIRAATGDLFARVAGGNPPGTEDALFHPQQQGDPTVAAMQMHCSLAPDGTRMQVFSAHEDRPTSHVHAEHTEAEMEVVLREIRSIRARRRRVAKNAAAARDRLRRSQESRPAGRSEEAEMWEEDFEKLVRSKEALVEKIDRDLECKRSQLAELRSALIARSPWAQSFSRTRETSEASASHASLTREASTQKGDLPSDAASTTGTPPVCSTVAQSGPRHRVTRFIRSSRETDFTDEGAPLLHQGSWLRTMGHAMAPSAGADPQPAEDFAAISDAAERRESPTVRPVSSASSSTPYDTFVGMPAAEASLTAEFRKRPHAGKGSGVVHPASAVVEGAFQSLTEDVQHGPIEPEPKKRRNRRFPRMPRRLRRESADEGGVDEAPEWILDYPSAETGHETLGEGVSRNEQAQGRAAGGFFGTSRSSGPAALPLDPPPVFARVEPPAPLRAAREMALQLPCSYAADWELRSHLQDFDTLSQQRVIRRTGPPLVAPVEYLSRSQPTEHRRTKDPLLRVRSPLETPDSLIAGMWWGGSNPASISASGIPTPAYDSLRYSGAQPLPLLPPPPSFTRLADPDNPERRGWSALTWPSLALRGFPPLPWAPVPRLDCSTDWVRHFVATTAQSAYHVEACSVSATPFRSALVAGLDGSSGEFAGQTNDRQRASAQGRVQPGSAPGEQTTAIRPRRRGGVRRRYKDY
ncbi:hypothetical protein BESB_029960 [Besnoitia besnoiti]|uniref:Uncharacterized protein n=1 Tax=Besnoitia besnoiti TaxID=94643 RepID=A0A2A9M6W2_BESBE|nr:hypothetical protein BESB_029960 [Besnoitia besnoiti]PFH31122.1 hypothetical protein BESB_029960 [Besnoitia besnoiti]